MSRYYSDSSDYHRRRHRRSYTDDSSDDYHRRDRHRHHRHHHSSSGSSGYRRPTPPPDVKVHLEERSDEEDDQPVAPKKTYRPRTSFSSSEEPKPQKTPSAKPSMKPATRQATTLEPIAIFEAAQKKYGAPDVIQDGVAQWGRSTLHKRGHTSVERLEMRERGVQHSAVSPHQDHFFTTVRYRIPDDKVWDVLQLSDSLSYDRVLHELTSRCAGWRTNVAILLVAVRTAKGSIDVKEAPSILRKVMSKAVRNERAAEKYSERLASELKRAQ